MSDTILVLNAGSSSIKFSLFPGHTQPMRQDLICDGECEGIGHRVHFTAKDGKGAVLIDEHLPEGATHEDALAALLRWLEQTFPQDPLIAAGHRVHGGSLYTGPVRIDENMTLSPHLLETGGKFDEAIETVAGEILERRWKKVRKYGERLASLDLEERHSMRKAMKKLRYNCEFFQTIYDHDAQSFIKRLKKMQQLFGSRRENRSPVNRDRT